MQKWLPKSVKRIYEYYHLKSIILALKTLRYAQKGFVLIAKQK